MNWTHYQLGLMCTPEFWAMQKIFMVKAILKFNRILRANFTKELWRYCSMLTHSKDRSVRKMPVQLMRPITWLNWWTCTISMAWALTSMTSTLLRTKLLLHGSRLSWNLWENKSAKTKLLCSKFTLLSSLRLLCSKTLWLIASLIFLWLNTLICSKKTTTLLKLYSTRVASTAVQRCGKYKRTQR